MGVGVAEGVAPGHPFLGVMLPYTPLHHLLLRAVDGIPLVMTSGNRSDEPIAYQDDEAVQRLAGIADLFLIHNRPIHVRCDDSVTRVIDGMESPLRRSRGYSPQPISLPEPCPCPVLATGGQLKGTFALGHERHAVLSHHMGDLDHYEAYQAFEKDIVLYQQLFAVQPKWIAHDLHPDYASTRYALKRQREEGVQCLAVQHHHAHMASCMAEHGLVEPVIGVSLDGTGYGTDGAIWGGEFLIGDYGEFRRAGHLRYVGLPGGDRAIREPWRIAMAHLLDSAAPTASLEARLPAAAVRTVRAMLERRFNTPMTSSAGRLFDAVASLAGVRDTVTYEGQAAIQLEWLAMQTPTDGAYPFEVSERENGDVNSFTARGTEAVKTIYVPVSVVPVSVDTRPLIQAVVRDVAVGVDAARIARRFHSTMVEIIADVCGRICRSTGLRAVTLSGGVFMNALLTAEVAARLREEGFRVYRHRLVPPNDGGISLGQLAIAARRLTQQQPLSKGAHHDRHADG